MTRALWIVGLTLLGLGGGIAAGQDAAVDVRTWAGQALHLNSASLDTFYTVITTQPQGEVAAPSVTGKAGTSQAGSVTTIVTGPQLGGVRSAEGYVAPPGADSKQGRRQQTVITVNRGGVDVRVPLTSVTAITFARAPLKSQLPPYTGERYRYSATLDLIDGSQVAGDHVNLGTAVLRGTTPQGTVDIPWQDIQTLRFQR
jgi:hypothetical protein